MPDIAWKQVSELAIAGFLLVAGIAFIVFGAIAFRRAAEAPRGWGRALHAVHALAHVFFGFVVLWALWVTST